MLSNFQDISIHQLVEFQVLQTPDAVAVIFDQEQLTYRELNEKANQLAHHLQTLNVGPEVLVGVCLTRSLEMVVALLGILKAGGAYVPLDPTYPKERLAFVIEDTQLPILLTQQHLLESIPQHQAHTVYVDSDWPSVAQQPADNPTSGVQPSNLAYVIYTSGSTGRPKGVAIEHRNAVALIDWAKELFTTSQLAGVLASTSLCFDLSVFELFVTLSCGGKVILAADALQLPNLPAAAEVTLINTVPSAIAQLLRINGIPTSVHTVNLAGEPLQNALVQKLYQLDHIRQVFNLYGPSEDTTYSTVALMQKGTSEIPSIGRPISNTQIYLLDSQLNPVPDGAEGELYISGAGLARGYLNRPELTAEKFIRNPFSHSLESRLYKTGDLAAYLPDGNLKFLGRIDNQVKIRGFRIELGEIEALLTQESAVQEAVVIAREDVQGNKRLVAYLVPNRVSDPLLQQVTARNLRSILKQKLPDYMVPSAFVLLDELPLTPNGKVDRRALPIPQWTRIEEGTYVAPRTPLETELAQMWSQLLSVEQVGIYDNFCELGGHSLLAIQLVYQVGEAFQIELPLGNFLETPTIAGLAQTIDALRRAETIATSTSNPEDVAVLDPTIYPENTLTEPVLELFLTGATGFLGTFLLYELLRQTRSDVYCLVRATSLEEGRARIQSSLKRYRLWEESLSTRIIPVLGDLSKPRLGMESEQFFRLAEKIDVIYHCGAWVNMVYPYSALEASNVVGTQEVLRLASQTKIKPLHFISTVDVFSSANGSGIRTVGQQDAIGPFQSLYSGYAQSKYIAEKLVMTAHSRGLPVSIYRPSNIMGHSKTGICQTSSFVTTIIKGCIQMGIAPDLEAVLNLVPVDYVSRAICHLSRKQEPCGQAFEIVNPEPLEWRQLVNWIGRLGYPLQQVSYEAWYAELLKQASVHASDNALAPLRTLFVNQNFIQKTLGAFHFDCGNTLDGLAINSIVCSPVNDDLLNTYFSYFTQSGFLNPPPSDSELRELMLQGSR